MKSLQRKAAELRSALMAKEAANNSTEIVIIILATVVIATLVTVAIKTILGNENSGVINTIKNKFDSVPSSLETTAKA